MNVSESRPRTTPLNFTLAPFGMDCEFEGCGLAPLTLWLCPKTGAVTNRRARPTARLNNRDVLVSLKFILASSYTNGGIAMGRCKNPLKSNSLGCLGERGKSYSNPGRKSTRRH